jgi:hypothetical protein
MSSSPTEESPAGSQSPSRPAGPTKARWRDRIFGEKPPPSQTAARSTKETSPAKKIKVGKRASAAETLSDIWGGVGTLAMRQGHLPLGRCLQFQAPVAGEMLDGAVEGTFIDKTVLQPIVKGRGRFDAIGAVLGPPLIVLAIERNPNNAEMLMPALRASIRSSLPLMVPAIKKVQERERKAAEAAAELFPDLPPGEDPVDAIITMMFAEWVPPAPTEQPETEHQGAPA